MHEVVFVNEFLWDDVEFDLCVFLAIKRCAQVEVGKVGCEKFGIRC